MAFVSIQIYQVLLAGLRSDFLKLMTIPGLNDVEKGARNVLAGGKSTLL